MAYKRPPTAMKKVTHVMILLAMLSLCLTSCSKDDDDDFAYSMEQLYGKWKATELKVDGRWYDVTKYPYTRFGMNITFYESGTFYGSGYLGNGSGTYKVNGKTITTYVSGKEYAVYTVNSLNSSEADLTLKMGTESLQMKAEKQY
jgi:heat shock protein HslJ